MAVKRGNLTREKANVIFVIDTSTSMFVNENRIGIGIDNYSRKHLEEFASIATINGQLQPLVFDNKKTDLSDVINWAAMTSVELSVTGDFNPDSLGWMLDS